MIKKTKELLKDQNMDEFFGKEAFGELLKLIEGGDLPLGNENCAIIND